MAAQPHGELSRQRLAYQHELMEAGDLEAIGEPMEPKWLAVDVLSWWLPRILTKRQLVEIYGRIVYEQVGRFIVILDGKTVCELDVGEILVQLEVSKGFSITPSTEIGSDEEQRRLKFWNWKHAVVERRRAFGLPVPDQIVWPSD